MFKTTAEPQVEYANLNAQSLPKSENLTSPQVYYQQESQTSYTNSQATATYLKRKQDASPIPLSYAQNYPEYGKSVSTNPYQNPAAPTTSSRSNQPSSYLRSASPSPIAIRPQSQVSANAPLDISMTKVEQVSPYTAAATTQPNMQSKLGGSAAQSSGSPLKNEPSRNPNMITAAVVQSFGPDPPSESRMGQTNPNNSPSGMPLMASPSIPSENKGSLNPSGSGGPQVPIIKLFDQSRSEQVPDQRLNSSPTQPPPSAPSKPGQPPYLSYTNPPQVPPPQQPPQSQKPQPFQPPQTLQQPIQQQQQPSSKPQTSWGTQPTFYEQPPTKPTNPVVSANQTSPATSTNPATVSKPETQSPLAPTPPIANAIPNNHNNGTNTAQSYNYNFTGQPQTANTQNGPNISRNTPQYSQNGSNGQNYPQNGQNVPNGQNAPNPFAKLNLGPVAEPNVDKKTALQMIANLFLDVGETIQNDEIKMTQPELQKVCQNIREDFQKVKGTTAPVSRFQKYNQVQGGSPERNVHQIALGLLKLRHELLVAEPKPEELLDQSSPFDNSGFPESFPSQFADPSEELSLLADFSYNQMGKSKAPAPPIDVPRTPVSPKGQVGGYQQPSLTPASSTQGGKPSNPYLQREASPTPSKSRGYLSSSKPGPATPSAAQTPKKADPADNSTNSLEQRVFSSLEDMKTALKNPLCERLDFSSRPTKIEVSPDLKNVWYGGEGLGLNQQVHKWFVDQGIVNSELEFCTLKSHKSAKGENLLIINDFRTWDLIIFDQSFSVIHKLKGTGKGAPDFYRSLTARSWYDNDYIVWLSSPTDVSAVRLTDYVFVTAPEFWLYKNGAVMPVAVLLGSKGDKLVGLGERDAVHTLHVFGNTGDTIVTEMQELFPQGRFFSALEFSLDENTLFVGCSEDITCNSGAVYLVAFNLNSKLRQTAMIEFEETREYGVISCMRRHPKNNLLFLGTRVYVAVVAFEANTFSFVHQVEVMFEQPVTDMMLRGSLLFVVGDDARGTIIHFDDNIVQMRDPNLNASKIGSYYKRIASPVEEEEDITELARSKLSEYVQKKGLSPTSMPQKKKQAANLNVQEVQGLKGFGNMVNQVQIGDNDSAWNDRVQITTDRQDKPQGAGLMITDTSGNQTKVTGQQGSGLGNPKASGLNPNSSTASTGLRGAGGATAQPKYFTLFETTKTNKVPVGQLIRSAGLRRIDLMEGGDIMLVATGTSLAFLKDSGQGYSLVATGPPMQQIMDVRILPKLKRMLVATAASLDLLILDFNFKELARLHGQSSLCVGNLGHNGR